LFDELLRLAPGAHVLVYSSTTCYLPAGIDGEVDEDSQRDPTIPRFAAEEELRRRGATLFVLSGLFGPGRDPASWVARGRIRNGDALVNLVHRDDAVRATLAWIRQPYDGDRVNVSTQCHRWSELAEDFVRNGRLEASQIPPNLGAQPGSKKVLARRLLERHPELAMVPVRDAREAEAVQVTNHPSAAHMGIGPSGNEGGSK
jgi:nucleoside-diphosphate-sugar epimerase